MLSFEPVLWKKIFLRKFEIDVRILDVCGGVLLEPCMLPREPRGCEV